MNQRVRPIIGRNNLNTLGDHMKHCGKAFSKRESKSFVGEQGNKKFSLEIYFMVIILGVSVWGSLVGITKYICVFFTYMRIR